MNVTTNFVSEKDYKSDLDLSYVLRNEGIYAVSLGDNDSVRFVTVEYCSDFQTFYVCDKDIFPATEKLQNTWNKYKFHKMSESLTLTFTEK